MIRGIIFDCYGVLYDGAARSERTIDFARELHANYKVALLSNIGRSTIDRLFAPAELEAIFDAVVLSSEVGMVKPDSGIYDLTAQRLDLLPEECLMIDDSPTNVYGAEAAGMSGLLFVDAVQCEADARALLRKTNA